MKLKADLKCPCGAEFNADVEGPAAVGQVRMRMMEWQTQHTGHTKAVPVPSFEDLTDKDLLNLVRSPRFASWVEGHRNELMMVLWTMRFDANIYIPPLTYQPVIVNDLPPSNDPPGFQAALDRKREKDRLVQWWQEMEAMKKKRAK